MLKWAVTPRLNVDFYEQDGLQNSDSYEILTLPAIIEQHQLPCLVRLLNDDINQPTDNYCLLLCETNDPYLIVSNETERFSIPTSFDGLFASVERGVTRYNIIQSVRSLQSHLKTPPPSSSEFSYFTTLQPHIGYNNATLHRIHPGTLLESCSRPIISAPSPSPSSTSSNRLRTLFANFPRSLNKHLLPNYQQSRSIKNQSLSNDYFEVKSNHYDENFNLKLDSNGSFVPVYTQLSSIDPCNQSLSPSNRIQGLNTTGLLSQLTDQYPLIVELIVSRTLEENSPTTAGYPFRRITLHRLAENHTRIIAFDMKNYAFIEIDTTDSIDMYVIEHDDTLFQRYQAQLRWCHKHLSAFRSQIKTIVHSSNGTAMFVQATPFHGQQLQQYHQRRNSSSIISSPLAKHMPQTIFTSQESLSSSRLRAHTPLSSKYYTTSNHLKYADKQRHKGKTIGSSGTARKDVRFYFNDPTIQKHIRDERKLFNKKHSTYGMNSTANDSIDGDEENDSSFQCTAL
ncbi:unnamed protein product [Rotaria sordida]|uniref:Uncharacterized protein n=1 Tax=Rotaria sordida TaxID=392033 RepID=A0A818Q658_9BILA|nr:unnamed protein product [Rotaria sordida]CAF1343450.1 unnamed protein product [Rotaria sordida]CAF3558000.1 unnamed protein product [Rotaria sordida]CAF3635660.1 unnamed protein product [Rotaria sordida]